MNHDYGSPGDGSPHSDTPAVPRTNRPPEPCARQPVLPVCQPPDSGRHNDAWPVRRASVGDLRIEGR